ncbi:uncharacterized protein Dwil_GK12603, isoform B [Drosophila willistoni]|uniref:Uncharacterized protein, isoform B n=1 Tax=Drosophila willistoni TaxID=7260 RepID=A0A0Q9WRS6_DROWI|nr:uncharacterized protein Dwil_GK12603, isoform B [Drosophila willistoni]
MEEDVLNALQTRSVYLSGGFDRQKRIIFIVNAFNDLQMWNRRCLQLALDYLKRSLSASILQNGVSVIVNAQETSSRISRQHVREIYALFGGDISVDLYLVRSEGFWEKHVEPCAKSQIKGEPLVLSKARLAKYVEPNNLPEELGGNLQFNYDLWLQQRKSIDEFTKTHAQTLAGMEQLLKLLSGNKSLRPTEADVELKKSAQLHTHVQRSIESAIEMGNAILARFNEVYETPQAAAPVAPQAAASAAETTITTSPAVLVAAAGGKPALPPDLVCERARIELRLNEIEKKQTAIRTAWLELLRSLREARELSTLEEGVAFVTNWILQQAEQLLSRQRSVGRDVRACETLRAAHDQLEMECRDTYGCYAELLYKIEQFVKERTEKLSVCQDLLSQRDFMQFVCRSFAKRLERRRNILMTALRYHRLLEQFEELLITGQHVMEVDSRSLQWPEAEQMLMQLKSNQQMMALVERELVREGEKLSDMLAMPVKDALGRDLQLDYSNDIAQLRRQLDASRERRQLCGQRLALQRLTLEQVTHIHAYEEDARRALDWLGELYAVLLRCHSHVGCNIHEIQLQKDELQGFEETGRSIYNYGCQLVEASQTLRLCCKLALSDPELISQQLQHTWHSLQSIAQEQMTRLRVSAVFHRSVEAYYRQLRELRPLLTQELATQLHQQQRQQHNRSSSGISSDADADLSPELSPVYKTLGELPARLQRHLMAREQLLVEVGRMVRLGRLLKKRLKEPFILDSLTGKRFRNLFAKKADEETIEAATTMPEVPSIVVDEPPKEDDEPKERHQIASLTVHNITSCAPLASEEEDLYSSNGHEESLSDSTNELSKLLEAINESTKLPELSSEDNDEDGDDAEADGDYDDDDDETASTSSVKTKIAKASIERDIILEEDEEGEEDEKQIDEDNVDKDDNVQHSLDKIKALIRNDSETYPQSDYTDNDTEEPTPSHSRTASMDSEAEAVVAAGLQLQLDNSHFTPDFSVVADELPLDSSPSPLHDSGRTSSAGSEALSGETSPPATLKILPTGSNELACAAITHKLSAIAEVAESLDAVIRDVQQEGEVDGPSNSKKLGNIEDWQSRSTEDESFATASEGNFTPNSHSSSFQTASGRTSSYIGSAKNSFDEADDSTLSTFEIPELPQSPVHNMSFDSSELSYFSAQQPSKADDQDSVAGVADLHSQSVTPTPDDEQQQLRPMPQPIESDSELEGFGLASGITTELAPSVSTAHTPEVSANCRNAPTSATATAPTTNSNESKPPASWRRSKYYENITKQTIKGFL